MAGTTEQPESVHAGYARAEQGATRESAPKTTDAAARTVDDAWRGWLVGFVPPNTMAWLLASAVVAALMLTAAYQARPTAVLVVGDTPHDTGLVRDFNPAERQRAQDGGRPFRWTRGTSALVFPGIGHGTTEIDLLLAGSNNPNANTTILANDVPITTLHLTPDFRSYHVDVPAAVMTHGSLELAFVTPPFHPPNDRRTLGIVVNEVRIHAPGHGVVLPPARIALSLWVGVICVALALLIAGLGGTAAFVGASLVAMGMAAFLIWNRLFLTADAGGVVRAGALIVAGTAAIRVLAPPLSRRLGLPTTARDVRWLAIIVGLVLALRFAGVLHPGIIVGDLTFHVHRFDDIAIRHKLILPVESKEFGGRTILYAPTPYLVMLPFSFLIHDRVLMIVLFALGIDAIRFCIVWYVARRVTGDRTAANLAVLVMGLVPVGWIVYSWGIFANVFAEGMLTLLFALLILAYDNLAGPRRWWWSAGFAGVIALTLLAHVGVFVLTALTVTLYLLGRIVQNLLRRERPWANGVIPFAVAGLTAAAVAFALFYRIPARDLLAGRNAPSPVEQEATNTQAAPPRHAYITGGATPDYRNGLPAVTTPHLSVALARETWEMSFAFYRVWPVLACIVGGLLLWQWPPPHLPRGHPLRPQAGEGNSTWRDDDEPSPRTPPRVTPLPHGGGGAGVGAVLARATAFTIGVWMTVAAIMLVVGIVARLYVRYPLYALPAVSLGAGILLARLVRWGRWGMVAAVGLLTISVISLAFFWYSRIVYDWKLPV